MEEGRNEYQTLGLSMLLREGKEITRITLLVLAIYFKHRFSWFTYLFLFFVNKGDSRGSLTSLLERESLGYLDFTSNYTYCIIPSPRWEYMQVRESHLE
ncbi:unnamed protein product [Rhizophagus irregularis]|nr:unnamed protein product [Rhizophagus irregularis]